MGLYDTVGKFGLQIKCIEHDEPIMEHYNVGDEIPLWDGLFLCYGGWFVVKDSKVLATGEDTYDKYGGEVDISEIVDRTNPVSIAVKSLVEKSLICLECGKTHTAENIANQLPTGIGFLCDCGSDWLATFYNFNNKMPTISRNKGGK